jgi:hypothetical protein
MKNTYWWKKEILASSVCFPIEITTNKSPKSWFEIVRTCTEEVQKTFVWISSFVDKVIETSSFKSWVESSKCKQNFSQK